MAEIAPGNDYAFCILVASDTQEDIRTTGFEYSTKGYSLSWEFSASQLSSKQQLE